MPERTRPTIVPTPSARSAGSAASSPPEVWASQASSARAGSTVASNDAYASAASRLRREPPGTRPSRTSSSAYGSSGSGRAVELDLEPRGRGQLARVPDEAEAGDVRHRVGIARAQGVRGVPVQRRHRGDCRDDRLVGRASGLEGVGDHAGSERLGEHEDVAVAGAAVPPDRIRPHRAGHGQTVDRLGCHDRVAAQDRDARGGCRVLATAQDRRNGVAWQSGREPAEREREERGAAHRVDVRDRVRRGDAAERERVVDDRREEVDRLHDRRAVVAHGEAGGVVERLVADQDTRIDARDRCAEERRQLARRELARAAPATGELGQPQRWVLELCHAVSMPAPGRRRQRRQSNASITRSSAAASMALAMSLADAESRRARASSGSGS